MALFGIYLIKLFHKIHLDIIDKIKFIGILTDQENENEFKQMEFPQLFKNLLMVKDMTEGDWFDLEDNLSADTVEKLGA
jgi:hypothetical protein